MLFVLPVPAPPAMLAEFWLPAAVDPTLALPVPAPPPVAVPAAEPLLPPVPAPDPSVLVPVPIELEVEPAAEPPAAVLDAEEPAAPSVALKDAPEPLPPLDTPAPLPAEPPLFADVPAAPVELLSPEFSFVCAPFPAPCDAVLRASPPPRASVPK